MAATETLHMGWTGSPDRQPCSVPEPAYVLLDEVVKEAPKPRARRQARPKVDEQEVSIMRDLVLGAFLGPQHFREDDGKYVAPYTTENLKGEFVPAHMLEERAPCLTPTGTASGRLPKSYVASLAKGSTRVIASETRPKKKSSIPLGPLAFQDAHIAREVAKLQTAYGQWLRYAYGDSKQWDDEAGTTAALWARVEPLLGKLQAKTLKGVRALTHLAVQSGKSRLNNGQEAHQSTRLAALMGVSGVNWRQHWAPRWKLLNDQLDQIDREALTALHERMADYEFVLLDRGI